MENLDKNISVDKIIKGLINQNISKNRKKTKKNKQSHLRIDFSKINLAKIITILTISIILTLVYIKNNSQNLPTNEIIQSDSNQTEISFSEIQKIKVYVSGEVKKSGVYELPQDARLIDALNIAGGLNKDGVIGENNLARVLQDGEQINFDNKNSPLSSPNKIKIKSATCVNINDSDLKQLDSLPGVGPVLAQRILDFREINGRFDDVSQLSKVEGIGKSKLTTISSKACV